MRTRVWWGNLRERDHLQDPGVDVRIILRWIFSKWDEGNGIDLRMGTGCGVLQMWRWTFWFHKMRGISWPAEELLASHEGLCCVGYILGSKREDKRFCAEWWQAFPHCVISSEFLRACTFHFLMSSSPDVWNSPHFQNDLLAMIYVKLLLNVLTMNPFNAGLGALYGPLILHMPPISVHSTVVNAFNLYAPCILYIGQTYRSSPEYAFYIFSQ